MPRVVRNFWCEVKCDGRNSKLATGPVSKDGGMNITLYQRSDKGIITAVDIRCYADKDGNLITVVDADSKNIWIETKR